MNREEGDSQTATQGATSAGQRASETGATRPRRALVCAGPSVAAMLERHLRGGGYATAVASVSDAPRAVAEFAPEVLLLGLHNGTDGERLALARRLRAEPATYGLPIVFLYHKDERAHRSAALQIGADDYCSLATPPGELCSRLDALFWRAEAGRRAAPVVGERRAEIDNFMLLLDAVRDDFEQRGDGGALALAVSLDAGGDGHEARSPAGSGGPLEEAHGFLKLNLRRADSVAFYGPTLLVAYLPRLTLEEAHANLSRLAAEFARRHAGARLAAGLAAFPAPDLSDVEMLVEQAEAAVNAARADGSPSRVVAYSPELGALAGNDTRAGQEAGSSNAAHAGSGDGAFSGGDVAADESTASPNGKVASRGEKEATPRDATARPSRVEDAEAWTRQAAEAGARELELRARGVVMPRRLLLAVSDPARMARLNLLVRSAGYAVRAAFDAQQALSLMRIERPDLLVIDLDLQGMSGLEALRRLSQQPGQRVAPPPAVLLFDARRADARRDALEAGARDTVALPCAPSEFLETVRRAGSVD